MKNIINTSKKFVFVTAISLLSVFAFSVPSYAHADIWSHLGNFFEDSWDDVSDFPGNAWDTVSDAASDSWDFVEDEVEDWGWSNDHGDNHSRNGNGNGNNNGCTSTSSCSGGCSSCGCGYYSGCTNYVYPNYNVYGPSDARGYGNGYVYSNYNVYGPSTPTNYNNYDSQLSGSCSAGVSNTEVGGLVTWTANATGGNGFYTYYWSGDEGLSSNGQTAPKTYSYGGTKNANLTITSNGQSITRNCSVNVNQVLAYTQTNPYVSSVYLSEIPQTGAGDSIRVILFTLGLMLWSTIIAYIFLNKRADQEIPVLVASENVIATEVDADTRAMSQIEDYARMNKIIISNGAVINLLKAKRLNDINVSETIRNIASSKSNSQCEWVTIGEGDLEKYL